MEVVAHVEHFEDIRVQRGLGSAAPGLHSTPSQLSDTKQTPCQGFLLDNAKFPRHPGQ